MKKINHANPFQLIIALCDVKAQNKLAQKKCQPYYEMQKKGNNLNAILNEYAAERECVFVSLFLLAGIICTLFFYRIPVDLFTHAVKVSQT